MCIPYVLVNNLLWNWLLHIRAIAEGYCFTFCIYLIRLLLCLSKSGSLPAQDPSQPEIPVKPRSQSARDPSQPKIPVSPRSQSTQDPSQPKIPVSPGCPHAYLAHVYLVFGSCLFDIWLMPTGGPPLTQKSLTQFPQPRFLAYVHASGGFSC